MGNPILVAGIGSGFEATLQYRIHDGHDERAGHFTVGGGAGEHGQFQLSVDVSGLPSSWIGCSWRSTKRARPTGRRSIK
ncbi:MAG: Gmad2 immunoglobulin-like domain-containing protein [Rhodoplanes sp.]